MDVVVNFTYYNHKVDLYEHFNYISMTQCR